VRLWIDAQLSPALAPWLRDRFDVEAIAVRSMGLERAKDREIFFAARRDQAIVMTKDRDFVRMVQQHGAPPCVLWITLGNTSNDRPQGVLEVTLREALALFDAGESLVEVRDAAILRKLGE
jgi:predicted nuclease of predicted toxin-antitoxin system